MSQRAQSNRSPDKPPRLIQSKPTPTVSSAAPRSDAIASGPSNASWDNSRPDLGASGSMRLQQLQPPTESTSGDSTPSRPFGVRSILNPTNPPSEESRNPESQPRSAVPSPSQRSSAPTSTAIPPLFSPRSKKRSDSSARNDDPPTSEPPRSGRRVLTPVSPKSRPASHGQRINPAAQPSGSDQGSLPIPGGSRHFYTAEPGQSQDSEIPPLPVPNLVSRGNPPYRTGPEISSASSRPPGSTYGYAQSAVSAITRPSESPNTSHSSYSNVSQTSPRYGYGMPQVSQSPYTSQQAPHSIYPPGSHASSISEAHYGMGQGNNTYTMTLDTGHGSMTVPVELDVQQASKVADEKRKRNAGASARFRARRKEKEKEASVTIASLEKDIKALEEERDFYFGERNFWRDFAARTSGMQLPPRPRSPPPRRPSIPMSSEGGSVQSQEQGPPEIQPTRSQRRRTGDYQPSFTGGQTSAAPMLPPQPPAQSPLYLGPGLGGGPLPPIQSPYADARPAPLGQLPPPPTLPAVSRSLSYDNLRPGNPFDRSWQPPR